MKVKHEVGRTDGKEKKKATKKQKSKQNKAGSSKSDKIWCVVCQNWVYTKQYEGHLKTKKHQSIMVGGMHERRLTFSITQRGFVIKDPPPQLGTQIFLEYFTEKYGSILALVKLNSGDILVQFEDNSTANKARRDRNHEVQGFKFNTGTGKINKLKINGENGFKYSEGLTPSDQLLPLEEKLKKHFYSSRSGLLDDQLNQLTTKFEASNSLKTIKAQVVSDLSDWLRVKFPKHHLYTFGSSETNLDLADSSDIDLYLLYDPDTVEVDSKESKVEKLKLANHVIKAFPDMKAILLIQHARVPVAKFLHTKTGLHVDLITDNIKGVKNSKFIAALQSLDRRIRPFLLLLKLWGKVHKFTGTPLATLTSYALSLLGIFYLQQTAPPLVPPVSSLQSQISVDEKEIHQGWNFSYILPERRSEAESTQDSVFMLLKGFFGYYQSFNPENVVICPLLGDVVQRANFTSVPPALDRTAFKPYFDYLEKEGPPFKFGVNLSVQDPFELNFNVSSVFHKYAEFQDRCKWASKLCYDLEEKSKAGEEVSISPLFVSDSCNSK